jgi:hypothetical protein
MEGRKNGENGKKIRRVVHLPLHNTGLHITCPFFISDRRCRFIDSDEAFADGLCGEFQPEA